MGFIKSILDLIMYAIAMPLSFLVMLFKSVTAGRGESINAMSAVRDTAKAYKSMQEAYDEVQDIVNEEAKPKKRKKAKKAKKAKSKFSSVKAD